MEKPAFVPGQYVASDMAHGYVVKWDPAEPDVIYAQTASGEPFSVSVATSCVIPGSFVPKVAPELVKVDPAPIGEKVEGARRAGK